MTDHKFTDDEIIKALECCSKDVPLLNSCTDCPFNGKKCAALLPQTTLALINRQKAEIESLNAVYADMTESLRLAAEANKDMQAERQRLNKEVDRLSQCVLYHDGIVSDLEKDLFNAKADAIKEFAEAVKIEFYREFDEVIPSVMADKIDDLVKEMTEETK